MNNESVKPTEMFMLDFKRSRYLPPKFTNSAIMFDIRTVFNKF